MIRTILFLSLLSITQLVSGQDDALWAKAQQTYDAGEYEECVTICTDLINADPDHYGALKMRGDCRNRQGKFYAALIDYKSARKIDDTDKNLYKSEGAAYLSIGEYKSALKDFEKIIELDPEDAIGHFNLGCAQYLLFKNSDAIESFTRAIELDPNMADAYYYRGVSNGELENHIEAIGDIEMAMEMDSSLAIARYNIGVIEFYAGNYENAMSIFNEVIELEGTFMAEALYFRGETNYALGDAETACVDWGTSAGMGDADAMLQLNTVCQGGKKKKVERRTSTISF